VGMAGFPVVVMLARFVGAERHRHVAVWAVVVVPMGPRAVPVDEDPVHPANSTTRCDTVKLSHDPGADEFSTVVASKPA
jgi:hypothetical protein